MCSRLTNISYDSLEKTACEVLVHVTFVCLFVFIFKESSLLHVPPVSPPKPIHLSPSKPTLTEIPGNTRPGLDVPLSEKLDASGLQGNVPEQVANKTLPLSDAKESFPGILGSSQDGKPMLRTSSGTLPAATSSKEQVIPPHHQLAEIPQTSVQKEGLSHKPKEPSQPM